MYTVTKQIHFCYGHRLLNYDGKCRWLHGHNGLVEIALASEKLDERGMVYDFTIIKQVVQAWIDEHLDHKMILHRDDPLVSTLQEHGDPLYLLDENPTAEAIARLIYEEAARQGFPVVEVRLWETPTSWAAYRG
ncbi:MAG: 6-carboxytetrahydropterin synthase [Nitrospinae bacterium]|nr:6-carboxytetrahydropterin synthase [Nitrospinota bacterium]MCH7768632.1 6-carboxytetrahydropterin synthase [Nitrospinota bacterium]